MRKCLSSKSGDDLAEAGRKNQVDPDVDRENGFEDTLENSFGFVLPIVKSLFPYIAIEEYSAIAGRE